MPDVCDPVKIRMSMEYGDNAIYLEPNVILRFFCVFILIVLAADIQ